MKKVHFVSLGCPKNLVDTEMMLGSLMNDGYSVVENADDADTVVVNTCGFIEASKQESIDKILEMGDLKSSGKLKNLVVAGCLTQRYKNDLVESLPEADIFIGSGEFQNLSEILKSKEQGSLKKDYFDLPTYLQEDKTPRVNSQPRHRAYLKISEGCKKRCAFCAIPLIRGNLQSRKIESLVNEAKLLVAGGVKELIVVSHDFTDYGWDLRKKSDEAKESPYELLKALSEQSGAKWIRVLYLYPDGIDDKMIQLFKEKENLVKYFDMPLQHINDQMLKSMNRRMTRKEVEEALRKIRTEIPNAVIRTQFIVGFPGETEEQFQELLEFVKEQKFDRVGCFQYSIEENTKAGTMDNQIPDDIKQRRHDELMEAQMEISRDRHASFVGQTIEVMVEGYSEETDLLLVGRNSQQAPEIDGVTYINDGEANVGDIVQVRITESMDYDLVGAIENS
ncbi:MAG TPA: 30S ribosomal protein S12 methylthiotransferase RimO [Bdellovibrionales bacterium]|nr:30S ribosomal protein S12 methylthiotransferase RimO [Pseudobdellovibrionaceae bacterium]HAG91477.1 30S ribosomal protein S12 methylthiotransferase RimO [Bdellovibrionales bacterium]|tara:strand:- start:1443 stop:2792 length:1350 start_codon:yes stop_codon:yes gene_type:complete